MKKNRFFSVLLLLILASNFAFAQVDFNAIAGGSLGIEGDFSKDKNFLIPFNAFASAQANFGNWGIFRANIELKTKDVKNGNIFDGQDANLKLNELSLVLKKHVLSVTNYFGFYLGTYEVVGQDEFLQRQFGIEPIASILTKNKSTLQNGLPLFQNQGIGFSYTANFTTAPGTLGFNFYFNKNDENIPQLNFDFRTAWAQKVFTVDFAAGIAAPLQNKYNDSNVFLLIDSLTLHAGLSFLLGSKYTHGLFIQAGIQDLKIHGNPSLNTFDLSKDLTFLVEPRIYTSVLKSNLTFFNFPQKSVEQMFYLDDPVGIAFSLYSDSVHTKKSTMSIGAHCIFSIKDKSIFDLFKLKDDSTNSIVYNLSITPFVKLPFSTGEVEFMTSIGLCDLSNSFFVSYKLFCGVKKFF